MNCVIQHDMELLRQSIASWYLSILYGGLKKILLYSQEWYMPLFKGPSRGVEEEAVATRVLLTGRNTTFKLLTEIYDISSQRTCR